MKCTHWSALLLLSLGTPALAQENLVVNGSFESPALASGTWNVYGIIPGWRTAAGPGIEIQAWDALEGRQVVELDSYSPTSMYQVLYPKPGSIYEVSFAHSPRPGVRDNRITLRTMNLDVTVDGDGTFLGANRWTRYTYRVTAPNVPEAALVFTDASISDGVGGLIDDVRVVEVVGGQCGQNAGRFTPAGNTGALHLQHTATSLADGRVLAVGGFSRSAEVYTPATKAWTAAGNTFTTRRLHTATLLKDGRVLVAGGDDSGASGTAEAYNPSTNTWASTNSLLTPRRAHSAVGLPDGRVLVMGGTDDAGNALASAELYHPNLGIWSSTGAMSRPRRSFTATLLTNGRVLVTGGVIDGGDECLETNCMGSAELYDPATGTWTLTGALATPRGFHSATRLANGQVLVTGGSMDGRASTRAEVYSPSTGTWSSTGAMLTPRRRHALTPLANGWVLASGGYDATTGIHASAELYDPGTGQWCATASMGQNRYEHTATLLADGQVLLTAGVSTASQYTSELYRSAP